VSGKNTAAFDAVSQGNNTVSGVPLEIFLGDSVLLPTEVFQVPANAANYYDAGWACQDGTNAPINVAQGGSFTVPLASADKTIICTLTNTRIGVDAIKSASPASGQFVNKGDVISYKLSVTVTGSSTKKDIVLTDTLDAGLTAGVMPSGCSMTGQVITCNLPAGSAVGVHDYVYTATVNNTAIKQVSNQLAISYGICSSCSTIHTLQTGNLLLQKKWVNATAGDTVTIPATATPLGNTLAFDAVSQGNNIVSGTPVQVLVGDSIVLPKEVFQVSANAANYFDTGWLCQDGTNPPTVVPQGSSFTIPLASSGKANL
jgi:fimbrial isopeptide formation D2 family protein